MDSRLTDSGIKMAEDGLNQIVNEKLHPIVFVSPLRRTVETACNMLKHHPLKNDLTLLLCPIAKEKMSYQNTFLSSGNELK